MTIVIFIIVLAVLIFVHELGHFIAARIFGIRVDAFAIGFGPKILSWRSPSKRLTTINDTEYSIRLIPFGGYVKIFGENPDADSLTGPDAPISFATKPRWQQAIVLASGVLCNFIFAYLLYVFVFTYGAPTPGGFDQYAKYLSNERIMITNVVRNSPASKVGIQTRDVIKGFSTTEDVQKYIQNSSGKAVSLNYTNQGTDKIVNIVPETSSSSGVYVIGITMGTVKDLRLPFLISVWEGFKYTGTMIYDTTVGLAGFLGTIFRGTADYSQVSGPVGIAVYVGDAARIGLSQLILFTAIISINLGIINLLPIPALDGGRILVVGIESVIRRRLIPKYINIINTIGFSLIMIIAVLITYNDVSKIVREYFFR
jgi:regulator of sigma E protease